MTAPAVEVPVRLNKEQAEKDARDFTTNLGLAFAAAAAAAAPFVAFLTSATAAAAESERAQRQLLTTLRQQTSEYAAYTARLGAYNKALQEQVNIDDDALAQLQTKLLLLGVLPSELEAATRATIGLAEITGQDLASAGTQISKVLAGNVEALKKLGITGKDIADVLRRVDLGFEAATERAKTFEGRVAALGISWGEFKETVGQPIIEDPEVLKLLEELKAWVKDITTAAEDGRAPVSAFLTDTVGGLRELLEFVRSRKEDIDTVITMFRVLGQASGITPALQDAKQTVGFAADLVRGAPGFARNLLSGPDARARVTEALAKGSNALPDQPAAALFGPTAPEVNPSLPVEFGAGEGLTVNGDKRAVARAQQEAERAAKAEKDLRLRLQRDRDQENLASLQLQREHAEAAERERHGLFELEIGNEARRWEIRHKQMQAELQRREALAEEHGATVAEIGSIGGQVLASAIVGAFTGAGDFGDLLKKALGQAIIGMGSTLIQGGLTAVALGTLSTVVPVLAPFFGGPAAIAAGTAAIAAGTGMVAIGAALSGGGSSSASSGRSGSIPTSSRTDGDGNPRSLGAAGRGRVLDSAARGGFDAGDRDREGGGPRVTVVVQGHYVGSERGLAREIGRILGEGRSLSPSFGGR